MLCGSSGCINTHKVGFRIEIEQVIYENPLFTRLFTVHSIKKKSLFIRVFVVRVIKLKEFCNREVVDDFTVIINVTNIT